ncbi:CHAT domain-containing protein [Limnospira fusiformis KN01]|uniref:SAV_2336 N-terminal domain-related protein n=1 Tax=Limnospira fusiformis TaxID=54297 RepID=UPI0016588D1F|nr:SAV_2336 N-terminal domain-related protein [Limnospira fusiformis]ULB43657.1 CHAT domain-containing protein [Limnospira fusiformis KN01]
MNPHLVQALQEEFQLSAQDIADVFWLACHIDQYSESVTPPEEASVSPLAEPPTDSSSSSQLPTEPAPQPPTPEDSATTPPGNLPENQPPAPATPATPQPPQGEIVPKSEPGQTAAGGGGLSISVPDAPSLREPLTLARALKPLMRRVSGGRDWVIDEVATSEQIASQGIWIPVLRPRLEPWLDLDLVIEDSLSMLLWRHTLRDLEKLLKNYGIFRDVRVWSLLTDNPEAVKIRRGIGATAKHQAPRSPKELIDPTGRRLVIVVSDCVSKVWREGKMTPILDLWAKRGLMAILQMLPEWMWKRSGLGWEALVRLQGLNPGDWNQNLKVDEFPLWWDEEVAHSVVKVPIFTLEPESVGTWARLLAGKGKVWAAGYLFKYAEHQRRRRRPNSGGELTAEKRVNGFRATASRVGRKLAGLLAAAPVITLPVVRLIQENLLKESLPVHVAEVFLGGLLQPISEINIDTDPELVQYDFMPGVRELLLESMPVDETVSVIDEVTNYVAKNLGFAVEDFGAILKNPQQLGDGAVQENAIAFARVTAQVLRSLGGAYIEYAEQLESSSVVEEPPPPTEEPEPEENQQTALLQFWAQLLQAEMEGDTAAVHQVMRENMGLIVPELGDIIAQSIPELLAQNPGQAEEIAQLVENTCISIQEFPYGRYAETLEIAIRGYDALLALGADNSAKARTLTNLGNVYRNQAELLGIDPIVNLEKAIAAYDEAAAIRRRLGLDKDLSSTLTNLGNAYRTQAELGMNPAANLERAITAYDEAAGIRRRLGLDKDLSSTLTNLGNAYRTQAELGMNPAANLERAIVCYEAALEVYTRDAYPEQWASLQNNLGSAYSERIKGDPAENIERAIAYYKSALSIYTPSSFPFECLTTARNLGDLTYNLQNWEIAIEGYNQAILAIEQSRYWASSEATKRELIANSLDIYQNMVQACINHQDYAQALLTVERSKSRTLVELLNSAHLYPKNATDEQKQRISDLRRQIAIYQQQLAFTPSDTLTPTTENNPNQPSPETLIRQQLEAANQQLQALLTELADPNFTLTQQVLPELPDLSRLLPPQTALIEWYLPSEADSGFYAFLVSRRRDEQIQITPHHFSAEDRQHLDQAISDYRSNYGQPTWNDQLPQRLETLSAALQLPRFLGELSQIKQLILIPHRELHIIPLHALPVSLPSPSGSETKPLQDWFPVQYAPSCQILDSLQQRPPLKREIAPFFAIQNPTEDLDYAEWGVELLRRQFSPHQVLRRHQATRDNLTQLQTQTFLEQSHTVHFACHAAFDDRNPLNSYLRLANGEKLTFVDIVNDLNLPVCRLVVLCSDKTGLVEISPTDDYVGLSSAFLLSGARTVVASLWNVDELAATLVMLRLYHILPDYPSVAVALQAAQTWLRGVSCDDVLDWLKHEQKATEEEVEEVEDRLSLFDDPPFESPCYWAGFVAIGG